MANPCSYWNCGGWQVLQQQPTLHVISVQTEVLLVGATKGGEQNLSYSVLTQPLVHLQTHEREDTSERITGKPMLVLLTVFWTSILHRSFSWHSKDRRPPTQTKMPALYSDFSIKCCTILITVFWSWRQSPLPFQSVHFWHLAIDKKNEA